MAATLPNLGDMIEKWPGVFAGSGGDINIEIGPGLRR